jgi:hypothetical protein
MRRAERAIYLLFAAGFTPLVTALAGEDAPLLARQSPMLLATGLLAVVANVSAVIRLRAIVRTIRQRDRSAQIRLEIASDKSRSSG